MIDWFVILTPVLLLPIILLFYFIGCSLLFQPGILVTVDINFYLDNDLLNRGFEFKIYDSSVEIAASSTVNIDVTEPGPGNTSRVRHQFSFSPNKSGQRTLSCQGFISTTDVNDLDDLKKAVKEFLIGGGEACEREFKGGEQYRVTFNAGISDSGTDPASEFEICTDIEI